MKYKNKIIENQRAKDGFVNFVNNIIYEEVLNIKIATIGAFVGAAVSIANNSLEPVSIACGAIIIGKIVKKYY